MAMELKNLHTFLAIIEEGSFSKAAAKLNYTQSTITFQMSQLAQELATPLFEKMGRTMVLTKAGEQLIPYVKSVLSALDKLSSFENDLAEYRGDLQIGVAESQLCYRIPGMLKLYHQQAPHARLHLKSMNCYDIRDQLLGGALDMGVFYDEVGGFGSQLVSHALGKEPLVLVASPAIREAYPDFVTPDRTLDVPFIINEQNCLFRQRFERYLQEKAIVLSHTIELWSIPTIKNLVMNDVGISFLPRFCVQEELARAELVEIPTTMVDAHISPVCAHHQNKWISPAMALFIELCTQNQPLGAAPGKG